jgi:urease accessory protein
MKKTKYPQVVYALAAIVFAVTSLPAHAHPGHGVEGLAAGLAHPFMGLDHVLAMVAVGLWSAAMLPKPARLTGPVLFVAMLLVGAVLAMAGVALPGIEPGIAASVALLGALLLMARRVGVASGLALIAASAVFHGFAHGAEMGAGQFVTGTVAVYAAGFMLGSAALHGLGLAAGAFMQRLPVWVGRSVAVLMGVSGLVLLATRL